MYLYCMDYWTLSCDDSIEKNKRIMAFFTESRFRMLRHAVFLLTLFLILFFSRHAQELQPALRWVYVGTIYSIFILMFYMNIYVLVPRIFFKGHFARYFGSLLALVIVGLFTTYHLLHVYNFEELSVARTRNLYEGTIISVLFIFSTTTIKIMQRWVRDTERYNQLKELSMRMELDALKNQINPHFLFNMLNNIKALTRTNPDKAALVIVKFSDFLRHQLYENTAELTALSKEVEFVSHYIDLEKIRREQLQVQVTTNGQQVDFSTVKLPPNVFMTFVENAIKHSVDPLGKVSVIDIAIKVDDDHIVFDCQNSISAFPVQKVDHYNGLGLANSKRRLELLYGSRFDLQMAATATSFHVTLTLPR